MWYCYSNILIYIQAYSLRIFSWNTGHGNRDNRKELERQRDKGEQLEEKTCKPRRKQTGISNYDDYFLPRAPSCSQWWPCSFPFLIKASLFLSLFFQISLCPGLVETTTRLHRARECNSIFSAHFPAYGWYIVNVIMPVLLWWASTDTRWFFFLLSEPLYSSRKRILIAGDLNAKRMKNAF